MGYVNLHKLLSHSGIPNYIHGQDKPHLYGSNFGNYPGFPMYFLCGHKLFATFLIINPQILAAYKF